jgi:hypothetical protein
LAEYIFENSQDKAVTLVIEPWAMAEEVPPGGKVVFEVADDELPEIQFAITKSGDPFIWIYSSVVKFRANGRDWVFRDNPSE